MFELTETIDIQELVGGVNTTVTVDHIKGGFPRIKICDEEFIKKINERKPREFSNKDILKIKDILANKKESDSLFDILSEQGVIINNQDGGNNNSINGISINTIIGLKTKK